MMKFRNAIILSALLVVFITVMDIQGARMWQSIGGFSAEAYMKAEPEYMKLFWSFAIGLGLVASLMYYIFRKDLSESLAVFIAFGLPILFGVNDVLFYWLRGMSIDATLPWLMNNKIIAFISTALGQMIVTATTLLVSAVTGLILTWVIIRWLEKQAW